MWTGQRGLRPRPFSFDDEACAKSNGVNLFLFKSSRYFLTLFSLDYTLEFMLLEDVTYFCRNTVVVLIHDFVTGHGPVGEVVGGAGVCELRVPGGAVEGLLVRSHSIAGAGLVRQRVWYPGRVEARVRGLTLWYLTSGIENVS